MQVKACSALFAQGYPPSQRAIAKTKDFVADAWGWVKIQQTDVAQLTTEHPAMSNPGYVTSNEFPSFQGVYLGRYDTGLMSKAAADQVAVKDAVAAAVKAALDKQKSTSAPWPEVKVTANGDGVTFIVGKTGSATVKIRARDVASMTVAPKREGGKLKVVYGVATPYTPRAHARHFLSILRCVVVQHSVNISVCVRFCYTYVDTLIFIL